MASWFAYLRAGLGRGETVDGLGEGEGKTSWRDGWQLLRPFVLAHWRWGLLGGALILAASLLTFPAPLVQRFLIDDVILGRRLELLPWAVGWYAGLKVATSVASVGQRYAMLRFQEDLRLDLQEALLEHMLRLPKAFFDRREVGYLTARIHSDLRGLDWFFSGTVVYVVTNGLRFVGGVALLLYLEWRLALAAVALLPLMVWVASYFARRIHALSHQSMEQHATILKHLQETITSMELVKAFASEAQERERVMDAYGVGRQLTMEQSAVASVAGLMIEAIPDLARGLTLILGAWLAIQGQWTLGSLLAFQAYLGYVYGPARFLADTNLSLQSSLAAMERVMALFRTVPEENLDRGVTVERIKGDIAFQKVWFAYGGGDPTLRDVSFEIKAGEHVAIVGPSGVGKTTLLSLLLGFYRPTEGEILFDQVPTAAYNLSSLRRRIGYVSQSTLLLAGSFAENLRYGNPGATREEVERACKAVALHGYISGLAQGYETRIDERGANLSEGQRQRLAIARALIKNPDILILDEPTSALDSLVERSILDRLPDYVRGKTLFIVAHRLVTIQRADRILLFNEKQLVAMGTHAALLAESGLYREMVTKQQIKV